MSISNEPYLACGVKTVTTGESCRKVVKNKGERCHLHAQRVRTTPSVQIVPHPIEPFDQNKFIKQIQRLADENTALQGSQRSLSRRVLFLEEKLLELVSTLRILSQAKQGPFYYPPEQKENAPPEELPESDKYISSTMRHSHEWLREDRRSLDCILKEFLPDFPQ